MASRIEVLSTDTVTHEALQRSQPLQQLAQGMAEKFMDSRAKSTNQKYMALFQKWHIFATVHNLTVLPADSMGLALFVSDLMDKKYQAAYIRSNVCAIRWAHNLHGYSDPTQHIFVKNLLESSDRTLKRCVQRKDPLSPEIILQLCEKHDSSVHIMTLRDICMITLGFAGLLRYDELCHIRNENVTVFEDHFVIHIEKSKNDQFRSGNDVHIAKTGTVACPHKWLKKFLSLSQRILLTSDDYLFKAVYYHKGAYKFINKVKPLSYTRAKECIISRIREVAPAHMNLGLHSLRAGGATAAAAAGISEVSLKRHGRWRSDAVHSYIEPSMQSRLCVSKNLGI